MRSLFLRLAILQKPEKDENAFNQRILDENFFVFVGVTRFVRVLESVAVRIPIWIAVRLEDIFVLGIHLAVDHHRVFLLWFDISRLW